jgi:formylglycine-generating enzyme required for sulfatase activity
MKYTGFAWRSLLLVAFAAGPGVTSACAITPIHTRSEQQSYAAPEMLLLPPVTFHMGSPADEICRAFDEDRHKVTLTRAFYIAIHETTQDQWQDAMDYNPSYFSECGGDCPVEWISWLETIEFCNRLSELEGYTPAYTIDGDDVEWNRNANGYRLPTEAEWEYACRGGTTTSLYNGEISDCFVDPICDDNAWYYGTADISTHPIMQKTPNPLGLYDINGNVWEWCWDWYQPTLSGPVVDPTGAPEGTERVRRGGAWNVLARFLRSSQRYFFMPYRGRSNTGVRLVRNFQGE